MATVTNWIDHLNKPAEEVAGAIYPGAGSSETLLVILGFVLWIGWHVLTARSESEELERLSRKRHGANDHRSNITCLLYTSPSPRDQRGSRMPSSA